MQWLGLTATTTLQKTKLRKIQLVQSTSLIRIGLRSLKPNDKRHPNNSLHTSFKVRKLLTKAVEIGIVYQLVKFWARPNVKICSVWSQPSKSLFGRKTETKKLKLQWWKTHSALVKVFKVKLSDYPLCKSRKKNPDQSSFQTKRLQRSTQIIDTTLWMQQHLWISKCRLATTRP